MVGLKKGGDFDGRMENDVISLLEVEVIQLLVKSSILVLSVCPMLICSVWMKNRIILIAFMRR